ncbi:MAG: hypothetical protein NY202_03890 [Mollicutes bacterium UO1]
MDVKEEISNIVKPKKNQQDLGKNKSKEKEIITYINYQSIHPDFTLELQKEWEEGGFSYKECKEWVKAGLNVGDAGYGA